MCIQVFEYHNAHAQHMHKRDQDAASLASTAESTVGWDASGKIHTYILINAIIFVIGCIFLALFYSPVCTFLCITLFAD